MDWRGLRVLDLTEIRPRYYEHKTVTLDTLVLLQREDIADFGLTLGQKKLFAKAITKLSTPAQTEPEVVTEAAGITVEPSTSGVQQRNSGIAQQDVRPQTSILNRAGEQFDSLFADLCPNPANPNLPTTPKAMITSHERRPQSVDCSGSRAADPRTCLTLKSTSKKAVHITDYISVNAKKRIQRRHRQRDIVLTQAESREDRLVVHNDDRHP